MEDFDFIPGMSYDVEMVLKTIKGENPDITEQRARWIFFELERKGYFSRVGKKQYCFNPRLYSYNDMSDTFLKIQCELLSSFPTLDYVLMETRQFNEWVNLLVMKNIIFLEVEQGVEDVVFAHLWERFGNEYMILLCPDGNMISRYSSDNLIIIKKLFSRAPLNKKNHLMTLEQLSVDLFADKNFKQILGGAAEEVLHGIRDSYDINVDVMLNYAIRRRCRDKLLKVWEKKDD